MNGISEARNLGGRGCEPSQFGLPTHNPQPRTERGFRRNEKRSDGEKNRAKKAWNLARSVNKSRYQKRLEGFHS